MKTLHKNYFLFHRHQVGAKALNILNKQKVQPHFGNIGSVETLIKSALQKATSRRSHSRDGIIEIAPEDITDGSTDEVLGFFN